MTTLELYVREFLATGLGQALLSFGRVFLATVVGCWLAAGTPLDVTLGDLARWVEVGLEASVALVVVNYLGPWEKRYGRQPRSEQHADA